jgi:hypothetical protein
MRRCSGPAAVLLAVLCCAPAQAQEPAPYAYAGYQTAPCAPCWPSGSAQDREPPFAVELMLGQESGVRAQVALLRDAAGSLVAEGFYGALFHDLGSSQALGAGARYLIPVGGSWCGDSFYVGPGVDVFFQLNHDALILLTPSVDVAWQHELGVGLEFEVGLDAGLGVGVAGRTKSGHSGAGELTTLISGYLGLRF